MLDDNTKASTQMLYESTRASIQERPRIDSDEFNAERSSRGSSTSKDLLSDIKLSNTLDVVEVNTLIILPLLQ